MTTSPFGQTLPEQKPRVLRPLRFCQARVRVDPQDPENYACDQFASGVIEEMLFCSEHGRLVQEGLDKEGAI